MVMSNAITKFLILAVISLLFVGLGRWMGKYVGPFEILTMPIKKDMYLFRQNLTQKFSFSTGKKDENLKKELETVKRENEVLKAKIAVLEEENANFRRLLQAPLPPSWQFIPANVLGLSRYLTVDKGEEDGVKVGNVVISENILVGKIFSVTPKTAKVVLPQDSEAKIPAATQNGVRGILTGQFGTKIFLENVLQKETLNDGDRVETMGEDYPQGLLIGKVTRVIFDEREPYKKAEITPLLDYNKLTTVFIKKD